MKKLVLIDGYSILFRAFYAVRNLTKSDGTPTGALYGFARMLIKLITEIEYTHIAVVFDAGGKTFRNNIYPEYKANRPPCPPELLPQFPLVRELVNVLNIRKLEKREKLSKNKKISLLNCKLILLFSLNNILCFCLYLFEVHRFLDFFHYKTLLMI